MSRPPNPGNAAVLQDLAGEPSLREIGASLQQALTAHTQAPASLAARIETVQPLDDRAISYVEAARAHGVSPHRWPDPLPPAHALEVPIQQPDLFAYVEQCMREAIDMSSAEVADTVHWGLAGAAHFIPPEGALAHSNEPSQPLVTGASGVQPLVSAYQATAHLAVEATAASDALESLKQLLAAQLQTSMPASLPPALPTALALVPSPVLVVVPAQPAAVSDVDAYPVIKLVPQPLTRPGQHVAAPTKKIARLPARGVPRPRKLRRQPLDVRGFFAGFVMSGAFGVVFYFFMTG